MPSFFKSLRSKSSRRSDLSAPSINSVDNDRAEERSTSDFGPRSPSSTTYGSVRGGSENAKRAPSSYRGNKSTTLPPSTTSPSLHAQESVDSSVAGKPGKEQSLMEAVSAVNPATPAPDTVTAFIRPSDLFAGRGVQWDAVKLAGPTATQSTGSTAGGGMDKAEDMQSFLKARRQWKPTFITEEATDGSTDFKPPEDLSKLTFSAAELPKSQGLKSMKDLEETHRRKQELLNERPLGASLFDEPGTSSAGAKQANASGTVSGNTVERNNSAPKAERKTSNRSASGTSGRRLFGGSSGSVHKKPVPVRTASTAAAATEAEASNGPAATTEKNGTGTNALAAGAAVVGAGTAGLAGATAGQSGTKETSAVKNDAASPTLAEVRESMDTNKEGFSTPKDISGPQSTDGHAALTQSSAATATNGNGASQTDAAAGKGLGVDLSKAQGATSAEDPTTPRASDINGEVKEEVQQMPGANFPVTTPMTEAPTPVA